MISCVHWVPRGALKERPDQYELNDDELELLKQQTHDLTLNHRQQDNDHDDDGDDDDDDDDNGEAREVDDADTGNDADDDNTAMNDDSSAADDIAAAGDSASTRRQRRAAKSVAVEDALLADLSIDKYDDEGEGAELFLAGARLAVHNSNADDPYITIPDDADDDSDEENVYIHETDGVLICGRTEEDASAMELYVFDEETCALYVHHDWNIPSFPLCMQYLTADPRRHNQAIDSKDDEENMDDEDAVDVDHDTMNTASADGRGNFLAIGTFLPFIEIWNLDVLDVLEPVATLGGYQEQAQSNGIKDKKTKNKSKSKSPQFLADSHTDAVLSLSWHPAHYNILASGSADTTVKLWDVTTQQCTRTLTHHSRKPLTKVEKAERRAKAKALSAKEWTGEEDMSSSDGGAKVQSIQFCPTEPSLLLTGAYDRTVQLVDVRMADPITARIWTLDSDVECVRWAPLDSANPAPLFAVAAESGLVTMFDARNDKTPLFRLSAHNGPCTAISFSSSIHNLLATSGHDKTVKIWQISRNTQTGQLIPKCVVSKDMNIGAIWSMAFDVTSPYVLACGGDKGKVAVWDIRENKDVRTAFNIKWNDKRDQEADDNDNANKAEKKVRRRRVDDDNDDK